MSSFRSNIVVILFAILAFILLLDFIQFRSIGNQSKQQNSSTDSLIQTLVHNINQKQKLSLMKRQLLKRQIQNKIAVYEPVITKFSKRYGMDWRLIVAQILKESRFAEHSVSHKGAKGLMQIMPRTAREISRELRLRNVRGNPNANIIGGIYHLSKQLKFFPNATWDNKIRMGLAAYNCGAGHLFDARQITLFEHKDPELWTNVSENLKRLDKPYYQIHLQVWPEGKPKYGYFVDYNQPLNYVEDIMDYYEMLKYIF